MGTKKNIYVFKTLRKMVKILRKFGLDLMFKDYILFKIFLTPWYLEKFTEIIQMK